MQLRVCAGRRHLIDGAVSVCAAKTSCAVEISIRRLNWRSEGMASVGGGPEEGVHYRDSPGGRQLDQGAVVRRVAVTGAVEIAIGGKHQAVAVGSFNVGH